MLHILPHRLRNSVLGRRTGVTVALGLMVMYGVLALRGPLGIPALFGKRREIRQLEEQNANAAAEIERRRERIERLRHSGTEQEMEIRKKLKLLRRGDTTFILPDPPKLDEPGQSAEK